jgi:hypothetical protein
VWAHTFGGVVAVALSRDLVIELTDPSANMLYFKEFVGWRVPGLERHAFKKVTDGCGIQAIGFTALHAGDGKVLDSLWVDYHDPDVGCPIEG